MLELVAEQRYTGTALVSRAGGEDQRSTGIPHEADPPARWGRLAVEQQADVDELLHRPGANHPGWANSASTPPESPADACCERVLLFPDSTGHLSTPTTGLRWATVEHAAKRTGSLNDSR